MDAVRAPLSTDANWRCTPGANRQAVDVAPCVDRERVYLHIPVYPDRPFKKSRKDPSSFLSQDGNKYRSGWNTRGNYLTE
jgi:hypothetical protein